MSDDAEIAELKRRVAVLEARLDAMAMCLPAPTVDNITAYTTPYITAGTISHERVRPTSQDIDQRTK